MGDAVGADGRIAIIGAAGTQAGATLHALGRAGILDRVVAVDRHWPARRAAELDDLGVVRVELDALTVTPKEFADRCGPVALVANFAGPFYAIGSAVLELTIGLGVPYLDICDDVDVTAALLDMHPQVADSGTVALIGMGSSPGVSNILVRAALDALEDPRQADVEIAWVVDPEDMTDAALGHFLHCFSTAIVDVDGTPEWAVLDPEILNFPEPVGDQLVVTLGHPEPLTLPSYMHVRSARNRGGLTSGEHLHLCWALARLTDRVPSEGDRFPDEVTRLYRDFDDAWLTVKERTGSGMRIDVTVQDSGYRFAAGSKNTMEDSTGIPAAAGILSLMAGALRTPGVWAPECLRPSLFFQELRRVSAGGGGLELYRVTEGRPAERTPIRDLLAAGEERYEDA